MAKILQQFHASDSCKCHEQLLHYTSFDVLKIMLNARTLKCNSLENVNDLLEHRRKGLEEISKAYYVACFSHYPHEIVPFWFLYGGNSKDNEKVLLRFLNFADSLERMIQTDFAWTSEGKFLFYDTKKLFAISKGGISYCPINSPHTENRQTIGTVRMLDIEYLPPGDEVFLKDYKESGEVAFGNSNSGFPAEICDARTIGKQKTTNWEYEQETRIICRVDPLDVCYFDSILLNLCDEVFRGLIIVANPWATPEFMDKIKSAIDTSTLPADIKGSISIARSELDDQIVARDSSDSN